MTTLVPTKKIPSIYRGNTFDGLVLTLSRNVDGVITPIDLTDADVLIQFKLNYAGAVVFEFKLSDNSLIISETNKITLAKKDMLFDAHKYIGDMKVTLANDDIQTYCKFQWEILDVVTV
jgi:hypothetical protein